MYNSLKLTLYTQEDCGYCKLLKKKLSEWNFDYREINISHDLFAKDFLKEKGHRTVPQLYYRDVHLNKVDTVDFTKQIMFKEMMLAYDENDSGVELFG